MSPAAKAWTVLAVGVAAWDIAAPTGQTLSEQCDRWLATHPWLTRILIAAVALHLSNAIPPRTDPLHLAFGVRRYRRRNSAPQARSV